MNKAPDISKDTDLASQQSSLYEIAAVFLKLGTTAFGGPAAHIAMMNEEIVRKRQWISREQFLDLLSATNFIPGPNSTELAIHIGHARGGMRGLLVAGACFILPAAFIVTLLAVLYVQYGSWPLVQTILYGIKPVIIAVVAQAIWFLSRSAVKNKFLALLGLAALGLNALGCNELLVISSCGLISFLVLKARGRFHAAGILSMTGGKPLVLSALGTGLLVSVTTITPTQIFLFFLKVGSVLFGSGYVLFAFLRADLVDKWHWLTEAQLLDAIAIGQLTPGPVFTTATFIGYLLDGYRGASLATVGIFLPAFLFVALTAPLLSKLRKSPGAAAALDGINVASLAVMTVACALLARQAVFDIWTLALAGLSAFLLIRFKINSAWLVLGGALMGLLIK